ncbi:unnamed protein product [Penicillium roqueforti FM164]|uniref:Genomic scaffold, ProqFM164S01 n=1 Tax=Penicillium roqueforti (strain FM164) TaxID=1365484 RepID=W6PZ60_PENRF|nr:unnamed protein product [Penicillium roqueforti FM164]
MLLDETALNRSLSATTRVSSTTSSSYCAGVAFPNNNPTAPP